MKKILILGLGHLSNGDITIAIETVRHLKEKGFQLLAISHPVAAKYIESIGVSALSLHKREPFENRLDFEKILIEWKPDAILCADVYTMDYASAWSGIDFDYLKGTGIPIGSTDQYEWESTNFIWDFNKTPVKIKEHLIRSCDFLICPCPLNKPVVSSSSDRKMLVPLFTNAQKTPKYKRSEYFELMGLSLQHKLILIVNSNWEYIDVDNSSVMVKLKKWMPNIIYNNINSLNEKVTILHIGPQKWDFDISENIKYCYFEKLDPGLYKSSVYHADLFCSTNATSMTLSMAVYYGTPSVLIQNNKIFDLEKLKNVIPLFPKWYQEMISDVKIIYPFRLFPWGWYHFLSPVLYDNPYTSTYTTVQLFEYKAIKKAFENSLFNKECSENLRHKQDMYFSKLKGLIPLEERLQNFLA
jgi:hypothetical protein